MGFFKKLFGGGEAEDPKAAAEALRKKALQGTEEVEGEEDIHVHGESDDAKILKKTPGADLVEEDGEAQWVDRVDTDVPRASWKDVWGPLAALPQDKRLEEFCFHERQFDAARAGDPLEGERKLLGFGYEHVGQFFHVRATILKHFATPHGENVGDAVIDSQQYMNAVMRADARIRDADQAQAAAANPELLAPVEGVTVELYARIAAAVAQVMQLLAQHKLDYPTWDRAQKVWNDRMSKDTTFTITNIYSKAFMTSGQGQFAGASAAAAATNWNGSAAGGVEPIPFDRVCEIQGAMSAWSKSGKDVNALLKKQFDMVAADWAAASTWWMTQLMADIPRFDVYNKKCEQFEKKYSESLGSDDDIKF